MPLKSLVVKSCLSFPCRGLCHASTNMVSLISRVFWPSCLNDPEYLKQHCNPQTDLPSSGYLVGWNTRLVCCVATVVLTDQVRVLAPLFALHVPKCECVPAVAGPGGASLRPGHTQATAAPLVHTNFLSPVGMLLTRLCLSHARTHAIRL